MEVLCTVSLCSVCSITQVCSVLESLEQEYKREEDWCGGADKLGPNSESDHVTPMISKHLEQKEAFLKVTNLIHFVFIKKRKEKISNQSLLVDHFYYCISHNDIVVDPVGDICSHCA